MTETSGYQHLGDKVCAEQDKPAQVVQPCQSPVHDEQFLLRDKHTGKPLAGARYRIEGPQTLLEGRTDKDGYTARVHTGDRPENLKVYLLGEEAELHAGTDDGSGCY